jgi:predicted lactoylglutathione lyase|tara:strand:- start:139 stop:594 length:456 start_codon:yes stop_codon:yes gene_type:complete
MTPADPTTPHVTLITLGVRDLQRALAFYQTLGWQAHPRSDDQIIFFQMRGIVLGLFGLNKLAADQTRDTAQLGTGAMTLAQNFSSTEQVDQAFKQAIDAGARPLKTPRPVFWGGYSGYFSDPDGHVWELAMNPYWPLSADGSLTLQPAESG